MHLLFQTIATRILKRYRPHYFKKREYNILPQSANESTREEEEAATAMLADKNITSEDDDVNAVYYKKLLPIGIALSLYLSNLVYLYLVRALELP